MCIPPPEHGSDARAGREALEECGVMKRKRRDERLVSLGVRVGLDACVSTVLSLLRLLVMHRHISGNGKIEVRRKSNQS